MKLSELMFFVNSVTREVLAHSTWSLHVGLPCHAILQALRCFNPISTGSWEFVTTLDYEWSVFRGRHRYLWTIWVCSSDFFLFAFAWPTEWSGL